MARIERRGPIYEAADRIATALADTAADAAHPQASGRFRVDTGQPVTSTELVDPAIPAITYALGTTPPAVLIAAELSLHPYWQNRALDE